jgi:hypothetical protein
VVHHLWVLCNAAITFGVLLVGYITELMVTEPPIGLFAPIVLSFSVTLFIAGTSLQRVLHNTERDVLYSRWLQLALQLVVAIAASSSALILGAPTYVAGLMRVVRRASIA